MKTRITQPKNNKYYIRTVTGGLNGAVAGSPTISGANVLCNCVGYANGRFNEIINDPNLTGTPIKFKYQLVCNAENFIESAKKQGLSISSTPIQGGIMVWQKGKTLGGGDGAGHVAVVEEVYDDGTIMTSESGYGAWAFKTMRRSNSNGRWGQSSAYKFRGCIINPGVKDAKVVPAPKLTVDGVGGPATVRSMQKFLGTPQDGIISGQTKSLSKYYPSLKAVEFGKGGSVCIKYLQKWLGVPQDGILGQQTVKKWQYVIGVDNDGIFGTNSMKAWQKFLNDNPKITYPEKTPTTGTATSTEKKPSTAKKKKTVQQKIVAYAKKMAKDAYFHYVHWKKNDPKTKRCPICHDVPKTSKYYGTYCTIFPILCWHHGGGIKIKCDRAPNNGQIERIYNAKTDAEALRLARLYFGIKDIKVLRNKKGIPQKRLQAGDSCYYFRGGTCQHAFLYIGDGKMIDANSYKDKAKQIAVRKAMSCKVAVRYVGK